MADTIFLTGGTGFLGTELLARLIHIEDVRIYVLIRAGSEDEAYHRMKAAWYHDRELYHAIGECIIPITGDFSKEGLMLDEDHRVMFAHDVTLVIHAGAEIGFQKDKNELITTNYIGTKNMLSFAHTIQNLRRFVHISTAYVAGRTSGVIMENEPAGKAFSSIYEKSKAKAEMLVRNSSLPHTICRPGMIVGDSATGWVRSFNTIYYVLKLLLSGDMRVIPVHKDTPVNIVPCDYVADSVIKVCFADEAAGKTFHLTCPGEMAPKAEALVEYVRAWAKRELGVDLPKPRYMPFKVLKDAGLIYNRKEEGRKKSYMTNLLTLLPYFYSDQEFDRTNTDSICGAYHIRWRNYMDHLLTFACRKNFMRQTGQTVFEQAMVRRASSRYPICYYDITPDGIRRIPGPKANERIEQIVNALWALGIRKGDRVALTGINSIDYMTLEQAIGLMGVVSVPIYYTTPAEETSLLLSKSGAKWFFIGDKRMMEQVDQIDTDAGLVSFSAGQMIRNDRVMRWKRFLGKGTTPAPKQYPDPDDLATIRYTSGTTGEPKGVMFHFGQLAWMGEVMTNILTWKDKNSALRYLSFLPLSHVVEGILASYAPYYMLSKVDYYYLNNFGALTDALPEVQPTVFFSVPRFYEKLWDQVTANRIGKSWLSAGEGKVRDAMGAVLKRAVLKKAGLDRCGQLIVGSAPVSEALLLNFRKLGIEIHNAYGQTEAPLITINRLGDNVIPSIGTPLPDTKVEVRPDGELIVTGPQVALGYYGLASENIDHGTLKTGDLGKLDGRGHITLHGRKKDFIITAYGKNISIPKIEERLKDIPGVSEAVLIGENRPYCTALIWLDGDVHGLDAQIDRMNNGLSHPEQIRRYKIIDTPLSIQAGELTPNLKVKRGNVEEHYAKEIEEMYLS